MCARVSRTHMLHFKLLICIVYSRTFSMVKANQELKAKKGKRTSREIKASGMLSVSVTQIY